MTAPVSAFAWGHSHGMTTLGIISDTHGLLRAEAVALLGGVELIVHAGDIGSVEIIQELSSITTVRAIRGNVDKTGPVSRYPEIDSFECAGKRFYVLHDGNDLDLNPASAGFDVVISGHSHRPGIETRDRVLYVNPGSAGPRRFRLPVTLAYVRIIHDRIEAEIVTVIK